MTAAELLTRSTPVPPEPVEVREEDLIPARCWRPACGKLLLEVVPGGRGFVVKICRHCKARNLVNVADGSTGR